MHLHRVAHLACRTSYTALPIQAFYPIRKFRATSVQFYPASQKDPWTLLGVPRNANEEEIKKAWRMVLFNYASNNFDLADSG